MTNSQAFLRGFFSVLDFSRPFSERPVLRTRDEMEADYAHLREKLALNKNVWDRVGLTLRKAMSQYEGEVGIDKIESTQ